MPRESESKRYHSRFDRESSPKRSRRDGKPGMERSPNRPSPEVRHKDDDDRKHRRRLQDPLPLEKPHASDSKHNDHSSNTGHNGTSTGRGGRSGGGWERRGRHSGTRVERRDEASKKKFREEKVPPIEKERDRRGNRGGRNEHYGGQPNRARGGVFPSRRQAYDVDKWKHDMFDEVNRSPPASQNEDDPVAKVEALLAL